MAHYELRLLDNAKDSFVTGVRMYLDRANRMGWKYAVLLIGQSVELFLKARLADIEPGAVFKDAADRNRGAETVGYGEAIARLKQRGVDVTFEDEGYIRLIRRLRNDVEHFEIVIDQETVDTYVASAMRFLDKFLYDELDLNVIDLFESAAMFQEFKERTKSTQEQIDEAEQRAKDELPMRPKDQYFWEIVFCPECLTESVPVNERRGSARCHRCRTEWTEVDECIRCAGVALVRDGDEYPHFCGFCT